MNYNKTNYVKSERRIKMAAIAFIALWSFWVVLCLSAMAAVVYTAVHFILKFW